MVQTIRLSRELANISIPVVCTAAAKMVQDLQGHLKAKSVTVAVKPFDIDDLLNAISASFAGNTTQETRES